jgi:peptide deformylase
MLTILPDTHPSLRTVCEPVETVTPELKVFAYKMRATLEGKGIGLAANQVGGTVRLIVIDTGDTPYIMFNPKITAIRGASLVFPEGCLSKGKGKIIKIVKRPMVITINWIDEDNNPHQRVLTGLTARVAQHELAHLDSRLYSDPMPHCKDVENLLTS